MGQQVVSMTGIVPLVQLSTGSHDPKLGRECNNVFYNVVSRTHMCTCNWICKSLIRIIVNKTRGNLQEQVTRPLIHTHSSHPFPGHLSL